MLIKITKLAVPKDWICSLDETAIKRAKCSQKICSGAEMGKHACNWGSVVLRIRGGGEQDKAEGEGLVGPGTLHLDLAAVAAPPSSNTSPLLCDRRR
ncbi:hypothetical protein BHM03_00056760 [Ensete ventricosum]|nr:hypothetical protein BHM03_00056760 [Ensete ventricosum]